MSKSIIEEAVAASTNRRKFIKTLGAATAAVTAFAVADVSEAKAQTSSPTATELAVLNFALNLEYLEAEFYTYGQYGYGIEQFGIATSGVASGLNSASGGVTTGGRKVTFSNSLVFSGPITSEIGVDERAHVVLLRSFLGSAAIAKPNINLDALGIGFGSENEYLTLARIFEDIGVSAYGGAAHLLTTPIVIQTAARILATESQHVGTLHTQIARLNIPSPILDGADLVPPPTGPQNQYLSINPSNGLPALRSVTQVLNLAYGGAGLTEGAFFPLGINGAFAGTPSSAAATSANLATQPAGFA
jgi:Ferritin-like domain